MPKGVYERTIKSYSGWHQRVGKIRGRAAEYPCEHGCGNQAAEWATIHGKSGQDVNDYMPLCYKCHKAYDGLAKKLTGRTLSAETRQKISEAYPQRYPIHLHNKRSA